MRNIVYYLLLLVFIALLSGYLLSQGESMAMAQIALASVLLAGYTVTLSLVGHGPATDERETRHRHLASRAALTAATAVLSLGVVVQLFLHRIDWWLLASLVAANLSKIVTLLYLDKKN